MKSIKYLGPRAEIEVQGFGPHRRGQTKEYPDTVADELVATAVRQRFELVEEGGTAKAAKKAPAGLVAEPSGGDGPKAGPEAVEPPAAGVGRKGKGK